MTFNDMYHYNYQICECMFHKSKMTPRDPLSIIKKVLFHHIIVNNHK